MTNNCSACDGELESFDGVHVSNGNTYELLCCECYNKKISEYLGINFDHVSFDPITMKDLEGNPHNFVFQTRLIGEQVVLSAFEDLKEGIEGIEGYHFEVLGNAEEDLFNVFKLLFERMKRALSKKHMELDHYNQTQITKDSIVRGRITSDVNAQDQSPMLVIDGVEVTWEEFGRMVSVYEGFNFMLEIYDKTEER